MRSPKGRSPASCHPDRPLVGRGMCRQCYGRWWDEQHPGANAASTRKWQKNHPEAAKADSNRSNAKARQKYAESQEYRDYCAHRDRLLRHGVDKEGYEERLRHQNGVCAICGTAKPGMKRRFFTIDHDHSTGVIRGLLCLKCNVGLGAFGDDPERLVSASKYLEERSCRS